MTHNLLVLMLNEQERPEDFNEKLKRLQSERDIINNDNEDKNFSYDNLESFSSNNFQFNNLEQFSSDNNQFNNLETFSSNNSQLNNNVVNKTININKKDDISIIKEPVSIQQTQTNQEALSIQQIQSNQQSNQQSKQYIHLDEQESQQDSFQQLQTIRQPKQQSKKKFVEES